MARFGELLDKGRFSAGAACSDCTMALASGVVDDDGRTSEQVKAADSVLAAYEVTLGHLHTGPYAGECVHSGSQCPEEESCDCEVQEHSKRRCSICGTDLAGYRHDVILIAWTEFN